MKTPTAGIEPASPEGRGYLPALKEQQCLSTRSRPKSVRGKTNSHKERSTLNPKGKRSKAEA